MVIVNVLSDDRNDWGLYLLFSAPAIAKPVTPQQKLSLQGQHARLSVAATHKAIQSASDSETLKTKGAATALVEVRVHNWLHYLYARIILARKSADLRRKNEKLKSVKFVITQRVAGIANKTYTVE